jgi:hypothetical protein
MQENLDGHVGIAVTDGVTTGTTSASFLVRTVGTRKNAAPGDAVTKGRLQRCSQKVPFVANSSAHSGISCFYRALRDYYRRLSPLQ